MQENRFTGLFSSTDNTPPEQAEASTHARKKRKTQEAEHLPIDLTGLFDLDFEKLLEEAQISFEGFIAEDEARHEPASSASISPAAGDIPMAAAIDEPPTSTLFSRGSISAFSLCNIPSAPKRGESIMRSPGKENTTPSAKG